MYDTVEERIAAVNRDLEALEGVAERESESLGRRRKQGSSIVYSVRLTRGEVEMLERQAAMSDLAPTVLARNLIRIGLSSPRRQAVSEALRELEKGVAALRTLVG